MAGPGRGCRPAGHRRAFAQPGSNLGARQSREETGETSLFWPRWRVRERRRSSRKFSAQLLEDRSEQAPVSQTKGDRS
jgi:hypothetical protein